MVSNHDTSKGKFLNVLVMFVTVVAAVIAVTMLLRVKDAAGNESKFTLALGKK